MTTNKPDIYIGEITEVLDPHLYRIKFTVPGVIEEAEALPFRGEIDEPKKGDIIYLRELDPLYGSIYLYSKLKENDFIGFRALGYAIDIQDSGITISKASHGDDDSEHPSPEAFIKIDSGGNIEISNQNIKITGDSKVDITSGNVTISGSNVTITGGNCKMTGTANTDMNGPFCGLKNCVFSGAPHSGSQVSGT